MTACFCCGSDTMRYPAQIAPFVQYRTGLNSDTFTLACPSCGSARCETRMTSEQVAALYADYRGESYNREREMFEPGYTAHYAHLNDARPYISHIENVITDTVGRPTTILDVGGNDGANTPFVGTAAVDVLEESDVPLIDAPRLKRVTHPGNHYDLAVLAHVLEHAVDPLSMVQMAASVSGAMYVEVPRDPVVSVWHEHINVFTLGGLQALLGQAGLTLRRGEHWETPLGPVIAVVAA